MTVPFAQALAGLGLVLLGLAVVGLTLAPPPGGRPLARLRWRWLAVVLAAVAVALGGFLIGGST